MKKQEIAKIPHRTVKRVDKKFHYIAIQMIREIKGESHLFVEIFDNTREGRKKPKLRMVFTKNDWCLYHVREDIWSQADFTTEFGRNIWENALKNNEMTYMSEEDKDAIWNWCGRRNDFSKEYEDWTKWLRNLIKDIRRQRHDKEIERRNRRLKDREENTPPLPEDLEEWADRTLFQGEHFLYYKRHGKYVDICCSKCGRVTTVKTKREDSLESCFEHVIDPPQNNLIGRCPSCGTVGTWKAQGRTKGVYGLSKYFFIGMPYKETGAVIRYLECEKIYRMDECADDHGTVMIGASEKCIITEIARRYFEKGKKRTQTDYHKYSPYSGENFWDDCSLSWTGIKINPGRIYEGTWKILEGTILQYSGAQQFQKKYIMLNLMEYMSRYIEYPQIEMLSKIGLLRIVNSMVQGSCGIIANKHASKPEDFFGIHKSRIKLLIEEDGDIEWLEAMQKERRMDMHWTDAELRLVKEAKISNTNMEMALQYMSMQQLLHKLEKYSGIDLEEDNILCGYAAQKLRTTADTYFDYLRMRQQRGYDLNNKIFLWPRNLRTAHDLMVEEINMGQIQRREKEVQEKFPGIRKNYRKLRNRYFFEDEEFLIRPARSAEEIVREGRILHHCVGGDNYLMKHESGISTILFLRRKESPEEPYITIEIDGTRICQWYGAYDRKPDKEIIEKWLEDYKQMLSGKEIMIAAAV